MIFYLFQILWKLLFHCKVYWEPFNHAKWCALIYVEKTNTLSKLLQNKETVIIFEFLFQSKKIWWQESKIKQDAPFFYELQAFFLSDIAEANFTTKWYF